MRVRRIIAALLLCLDLTPTWAIETKGAAPPASTAHQEISPDCVETNVQISPLPARPALRRATHAHKPTRHRHAHAKAHKRTVVHRKNLGHRKHRVLHRRPLAASHRRPASARLHRLSYPSPICAKRSHLINALIGLPDYDEAVTQPLIPPVETAEIGTITTLPPFWPTPESGTVDSPPTIFPYTPIYPPGPGPIILPPVPPVGPNPPLPPPVFPIPSAPEPGAWMMISLGFALAGRAMRRRARGYSGSHARSSPP